jgi:hypothetical protein
MHQSELFADAVSRANAHVRVIYRCNQSGQCISLSYQPMRPIERMHMSELSTNATHRAERLPYLTQYKTGFTKHIDPVGYQSMRTQHANWSVGAPKFKMGKTHEFVGRCIEIQRPNRPIPGFDRWNASGQCIGESD